MNFSYRLFKWNDILSYTIVNDFLFLHSRHKDAVGIRLKISIATRSYNPRVERSTARVSRGGLIDINNSSIGNPDSRPGVVHDCTHGKMATGPRAPVSALPCRIPLFPSLVVLSFFFSPALPARLFLSLSFSHARSLALPLEIFLPPRGEEME